MVYIYQSQTRASRLEAFWRLWIIVPNIFFSRSIVLNGETLKVVGGYLVNKYYKGSGFRTLLGLGRG